MFISLRELICVTSMWEKLGTVCISWGKGQSVTLSLIISDGKFYFERAYSPVLYAGTAAM